MAKNAIHTLPLSSLPAPLETGRRLRDLDEVGLRDLLRRGPVRFVVAMMLSPFRVVPEQECFEFWKSEVQPHLASNPDGRASLDEFPDGYCYFASEWTDGGSPIVLLSAAH
jgi:hypothetical protein